MVPIILTLTIVGVVLIMGLTVYERLKKVKPGDEYRDERADMCSLKATRNAFIIAVIVLAIYMMIGQISPTSLYKIQALQVIYGVSVATYVVSWSYYIRFD
jgi:hypothetical protein